MCGDSDISANELVDIDNDIIESSSDVSEPFHERHITTYVSEPLVAASSEHEIPEPDGPQLELNLILMAISDIMDDVTDAGTGGTIGNGRNVYW